MFLVFLLLLLSLILFYFKLIVLCHLFDLVLQIFNCILVFIFSKQSPLFSIIYFIGWHIFICFLSRHLFVKTVITHKSKCSISLLWIWSSQLILLLIRRSRWWYIRMAFFVTIISRIGKSCCTKLSLSILISFHSKSL